MLNQARISLNRTLTGRGGGQRRTDHAGHDGYPGLDTPSPGATPSKKASNLRLSKDPRLGEGIGGWQSHEISPASSDTPAPADHGAASGVAMAHKGGTGELRHRILLVPSS